MNAMENETRRAEAMFKAMNLFLGQRRDALEDNAFFVMPGPCSSPLLAKMLGKIVGWFALFNHSQLFAG